MISRRRFLIRASLAAAGAAAGVVLTANNPFETPTAEAAPGDELFTYLGRKVVITSSGRNASLTINGRHVHVEYEGGKYLTHLLPFQSFTTVRQLARAVIDGAVEKLFVI